MSDPATAVFTRRVRPGHEAAYEQLAREAAAAATRVCRPFRRDRAARGRDGRLHSAVQLLRSRRTRRVARLAKPAAVRRPGRTIFGRPTTNRLASRDSRPGSSCRTSDARV